MKKVQCYGCRRKVRWDEVEMIPNDEQTDMIAMHIIDDPDSQLCGPVEEAP